ncbi:hypothetical protein TNCV_3691081 [Trichonephila clavipes]|nr:hypothetical protein TNCV_3691081 [Trichonephila clavipes]
MGDSSLCRNRTWNAKRRSSSLSRHPFVTKTRMQEVCKYDSVHKFFFVHKQEEKRRQSKGKEAVNASGEYTSVGSNQGFEFLRKFSIEATIYGG